MQEYTTVVSVVPKPDLVQGLREHERLVHWVVRRQWLGGLSYAEAVQIGTPYPLLWVGRIALWRALQHYDVRRGTAFSSYAVPAIARAVWRAVAQAQPREVFTPHPPQEAPDLDEEVQRSLLYAALYPLVASLPEPLGYVIVAHYGLDGHPVQTFAAIGQSLGVTRQRVQQLEAFALLWLAHPARSLPLRKLLDRNSVADYGAYLARLRTWLRARRGAR